MRRPTIRFPGLLAVCLFGAASQTAAAESGSSPRVLSRAPACVEKRLGLVMVELGGKEEQDRRSAMQPTRVSYRSAFDKLAAAAQEKGGDAVVLRGHEAAYMAKSGRRTWHPSYVWLKGAVVRLEADAASCELAVIDPAEYGAEARRRQRQDVRKDAGVSF